MKVILITIFITVIVLNTNAKVPDSNSAECKCADLFDETVSKIELNYIGFHVEFKGKREEEFKNSVGEFKAKALKTPIDTCIPLLQKFISFFRDGHLFIGQNPKLTDEQVAEISKAAKKVVKSEIEI